MHPTIPTVPVGIGGLPKPNIVDGGADYIERNALALVALIKQVNSKLLQNGSTSKLAVFGPSMGGQISRYALAYMEKKFAQTGVNSWKHNTYLWVSIDSPHLGANIPMGVQSLLNLAKESSDGAKEFYEKGLGSPAARQQIIEFHKEKPVTIYPFGNPIQTTDYNNADPNNLNSQTTLQNMPINRGSSFFQQHYNSQFNNGVVNSKGWPVNLRKIAMTNGSLTGSKETIKPSGAPGTNFAGDGAKILNIRGFQRFNYDLPWPLGSITFRVHIASLESHFMPSTGSNGRICRFKKLFDDKTTNALNNNSRGVMDNVPGGYFKAQGKVADETLATDPVSGTDLSTIGNWAFNNISIGNIIYTISQQLGGSEWYLHEFNPNHSFIPTFSSLAITNPNQNWNNPLNTNLTCPTNRRTPFDSYYGEAKNSEHTSFTYNSVEWLLKELANNPQAPYFPLQPNLLTGTNTICLNSNATYSFGDICKLPSTSTWSVTSNLQIVSSTGTSIIVNGTTSGSATITATFQNGQTITKTIWIGLPTPVGYTKTGSCEVPIYNFYSSQGQFVNQWKVTVNGVTEWISGSILIINPFDYMAPGQTKIFYYQSQNDCGLSTIMQLSIRCPHPRDCITSRMSNSTQNFYKIYPNPTNNIVNVELKTQDQKPNPNAVIISELYNMMGELKRNVTITNNIATIDVSGLPRGIYLLKINIDGVIESHQVGVE